MKKLIFLAFLCIFTAGCWTVNVETVEPWEGHYKTKEEFQAKTSDMELKEGQSVWVISNGTMYRLLRKTEK